ncbi:fibronectin type III domain-containing protein [Streptomyces sp. KR80]|uniref:fibronectin type III domain-containing protein n=1 Tax=Streptomyces sp. KR80 TaxID=3457426 RepID=UPI003FD39466
MGTTRVVARSLAAALLAAAGLAGCAGVPSEGPSARKPETRLAASMVSPVDVTLHWSGRDPGAAGRVVEFATERKGRYTILQFLPPGRTTFTHPDLMPKTTFYYRLRSFYGPASRAVHITLPEGGLSERDRKSDHKWAVPRTIRGEHGRARSIRNADTAASARPTELKATVMHANGIRLTWTDRARDEEGYLIEVRPDGDADFTVAAVVDPDIDSTGLITLPNEKRATYRVRAYYYGDESNVVHRTTGSDPS